MVSDADFQTTYIKERGQHLDLIEKCMGDIKDIQKETGMELAIQNEKIIEVEVKTSETKENTDGSL